MSWIWLWVHLIPGSPLSTFRSQCSPPKVSEVKYKNLHSHAVVLPCRFWPLSLEQTYNIYITYKKSLYICTHRQHIERGRTWIYTPWNCQGFPVVPTGHSIFCSYDLCGFSFIHISKKLHKTTTQAGYQITAGISTISYLILSRYFSKPTITSNEEISKKNS